MYIQATLAHEQLISKVTLQQQRTHTSYTSLGTQTCRADILRIYGNRRQFFQSKHAYGSSFTYTSEHWNNSYGSSLTTDK